ncbi:D-amino-acid transaminase [Paenibacillus hamazuiensis]|uniref:D-amino-acid transaminase n=1 Tax=Paenibacillus hamazuiensis TaxID=2936508 RepID=UPI00200BED58|nr:D-amino-acid transaminase [Paenibacillus hamazuiensis]
MYFFENRFMPKNEVAVSPDDRGYYFGDGIYEVFRVYNGRLFEAEAHFERLVRSAEGIRIELPFSKEEIHSILNKLIDMNHISEGTVYMQVTRGAAPRVHPFPAGAKPVLMAYCNEVKRPLQTMRQGIAAVTMEDIRWLRCDLKTLNLLGNVLAKQHALDQGADDVILHRSGTVTECSASNFFIVREGKLLTHPANHLILHGITRMVTLRLAHEFGIPVLEEPFAVQDLRLADEAFITGTTAEITPVVRIDGKPVKDGVPGPITKRLQDAFEQAIQWSEADDRKTYIKSAID